MLIFKTHWIILKVHKVWEKDFLYTIFTEEYGKIICQKKISAKEKTLDLGYEIQFEIETKEERKVHKMRNIKILSDFAPSTKNFWVLQKYLEILAYILNNSPDWLQIFGIIEIIQRIHNFENISEEKLLLSFLKVAHIYGNLPEHNADPIVQKILNFIHTKKISEVLRLSWIEKYKKELEQLF